LSAEGFIEFSFDIIGDAKIDGSHIKPLLKLSTILMVTENRLAFIFKFAPKADIRDKTLGREPLSLH
jgi:hypothetical protein